MYQLSEQQKQGLLDYLNGTEGATLDTDAAQSVLNMAAALGKALLQHNRRLSGENASLRRRMERQAEKTRTREREIIEGDGFDGTGLDSVTVGLAALYKLQEKGYRLSKRKFILLMYLCYCSYLYRNDRRLFTESPRVVKSEEHPEWGFRIVFWNLSKKVGTPSGYVDNSAWLALGAANPKAASYISNWMEVHGREDENDLLRLVQNSAPFKEAVRKAEANSRLTWDVSDKDIWLWRDSARH